MLQFQYIIYLVVAVIVIIGIGVVGVMLIRRGRRAAAEGLFEAAPEEESAKAVERDKPAPPWPTPTAAAAAAAPHESTVYVPEPAPAAEPDYLHGVDQLLTEWRTKHELAASQATTEEAPEPEAQAAEAPEPEASAADAPATVSQHAAPASAATGATQAQVLEDPLGTVILDLLGGEGKLTGAELKRLEVFRPERIDLAVQTFQMPTCLQGDEDVDMRLAQIQLYAATLELRSKWSAQMSRRAGDGGGAPYSAHDFKLKIARDIMDLPAPDRAEVIGLLLGGLLSSPGSTPQLKRAVIDTLEYLRSAALINVLLDCLDDPDPIVQDYALAAADRMLEG